MLRLGLGFFCLTLSGAALAGSTPFKLGLLTNIPEATGGEVSLDLGRFLTVQGTYSTPLPVKVEVGVPSKKLVSSGDFAIRSPYLNLPFDVDFGPQWSIGGLVFPWGGSFYLGLAHAHRTVTVRSHVESTLIFEDSDSQVESNTSFGVDLRTRTDQDLLRASLGQRATWGHIFLGWYLGAVQPVGAHSRIENHVSVQNPHATDSSTGSADNLEEARVSQETVIDEKVRKLLHDFEKQTLPLIGLEIGIAF